MNDYIITAKGLTVFAGTTPMMLLRDDARWDGAIDALRDGNFDQLIEILTPAKAIERFVSSNGRMTFEAGVVYLDGVELDSNGAVVRKILSYAADNLPLEPLMMFFMRLQANPSYRVRKDLLTFLEVGELPISSDGRFLAYKKVRHDFKDLHSGTVNYSVGSKPSMPRNAVDDDPDNTCSCGLHVCSWQYLSQFGSHSDPVVVCAIDPRDVVSIPADYNNTKMRVCAMEVLEQIEPPTCANVWGSQLVDQYDADEDEDENDDERDGYWNAFGEFVYND
jgi:hypothetical protein